MGVGAGLCMCDVVKKVHVRYLISRWVLVKLVAIRYLEFLKNEILMPFWSNVHHLDAFLDTSRGDHGVHLICFLSINWLRVVASIGSMMPVTNNVNVRQRMENLQCFDVVGTFGQTDGCLMVSLQGNLGKPAPERLNHSGFDEGRDDVLDQLDHLHIICTSLQTVDHASKFFYRPDALPVVQPTVSQHWRQ